MNAAEKNSIKKNLTTEELGMVLNISDKQFTVEVYKQDKRIKNRSDSVRWGNNKPGLRFVLKQDYEGKTREELEELCKTGYPERLKFVTEIHETYVTRKNLMSGEEYRERYDRPHYCSPSSESYWSM
tara:strand:+ start:2752 stop:3132 length:381 start_codon:yes stop_codon:yes gene_type:complete